MGWEQGCETEGFTQINGKIMMICRKQLRNVDAYMQSKPTV